MKMSILSGWLIGWLKRIIMLNQPTLRMIQRRKELLGRRGLKKQAPIMTYPKVIEKKYQAELINFVNVIAKEID